MAFDSVSLGPSLSGRLGRLTDRPFTPGCQLVWTFEICLSITTRFDNKHTRSCLASRRSVSVWGLVTHGAMALQPMELGDWGLHEQRTQGLSYLRAVRQIHQPETLKTDSIGCSH